ncbi:MAG: MBL fold metallo-hydrolase, partial [Dehalococcoidia bacterium]
MTQVPNVTLKVGDVEVTAIYDMDFDVDRDRIFPSIAAEEWTGLEDFLTAEGKVRLTIVSYLIRSQGKTILCDTGLGVVPGTQQPGALMDGLRAAGAAPEDIDTVIFTHLHGDHTGWNITKVDGEPRLTFPNARYLIHELEWRHSSSPERASNPAFIERLQPLEPLGALTLLSGERTALTDEVTAVSTFG